MKHCAHCGGQIISWTFDEEIDPWELCEDCDMPASTKPVGPEASDVSALIARGYQADGYRVVPHVAHQPSDPS
jgi:hypothetical protein